MAVTNKTCPNYIKYYYDHDKTSFDVIIQFYINTKTAKKRLNVDKHSELILTQINNTKIKCVATMINSSMGNNEQKIA